ncbi:MAG: hypothetical protein U9N11_03900 [Campylobacterota bacterium]|nr:hypothetical protein [Campylobacterota bacterium]
MKKLTLSLLVATSIIFSGCGAIKGAIIYEKDRTLETITQVRALPMQTSVGFEWKKLEDSRIHGVNIYRGYPSQGSQGFKRVGSVNNVYATHFVDNTAKQNTEYIYTFTTFSLGKESNHGALLNVKTRAAEAGVNFAQAIQVTPTVVKLLWRPHSNQSVNKYIVERSMNNSQWTAIGEVEGQIAAEYVDTFIHSGNHYKYRVIAKRYDGALMQPSKTMAISL